MRNFGYLSYSCGLKEAVVVNWPGPDHVEFQGPGDRPRERPKPRGRPQMSIVQIPWGKEDNAGFQRVQCARSEDVREDGL